MARNALAAVCQALASALSLFVLYRYLVATLGIERLGIWSLVLASASISRFSDLGLTGSATKFVARHLALGDERAAGRALETSVVALGAMMTVLLAIAWLPVTHVVERVMPDDRLVEAMRLLPIAFLSVLVATMAAAATAGLDGTQRIELRAWIMTGTTLMYTLLGVLWVRVHGLQGLAWAQVVQNVVLLGAAWYAVRRRLPTLSFAPWRIDAGALREMLGYGVRFQIASFGRLLLEPVSKVFMTHYGGLAMTGYFEMATKMVVQSRGLILSANQVLVPHVATLHEIDRDRVGEAYLRTWSITCLCSLLLFGGLVALLPFVSEIWVGSLQPAFLLFAALAIGAWLANTLVTPAFFSNVGTGDLGWNAVAAVSAGGVNVAAGYALGHAFGAAGVAASYALALLTSSTITLLAYHRRHAIPLGELARPAILGFALLVGLAGAGAALLYPLARPVAGPWAALAATLLAFGVPPLLALGLGARRGAARRLPGFDGAVVPAGPTGPTGPPGPTGPAGAAP